METDIDIAVGKIHELDKRTEAMEFMSTADADIRLNGFDSMI